MQSDAYMCKIMSSHQLLKVGDELPMSLGMSCPSRRLRHPTQTSLPDGRTELAITHLLCSLQPLLCTHQLVALGRHVGTLLCRPQQNYAQ